MEIQDLLASFFASMISVLSEETSGEYASHVLKNFIQSNTEKYPFVEYIDLNSLSPQSGNIIIDSKINKVNTQTTAEFITAAIDNLFPKLFKKVLATKLEPNLHQSLKSIGVKFTN